MTGFRIGDTDGIGVMRFPHRRHQALYIYDSPTVIRAVAYFRSDTDAEITKRLLRLLAKGVVVEDETVDEEAT